jgi:hypothetical protein
VKETPKPEWIKSLLAESLDWPDVPLKTLGRVILKLWPPATTSNGGIVLPDEAQRQIFGVAWVYRAVGPIANVVHKGDIVILRATTLKNGLCLPAEGKELDDYRIVMGEDLEFFLPYEQALAKWEETCRLVEVQYKATVGDIEALLAAGKGLSAAGRMVPLKARASFMAPALVDEMMALDKRIAAVAMNETAGKLTR